MAMGVKRSFAEMQERNMSVSAPPSAPPSRFTSPDLEQSRSNTPHKLTHPLVSPNYNQTPRGSYRDADLRRQRWDPDASIVLVGLQGSGKSSLAVLAASAYNRRLIDFDRAFVEKTGQTLGTHRHSMELSEHHKRHRQIFEEFLNEHSTGCVIVCSFADLERGARSLRHFALSHPVIHVVRDVHGIQDHVKVWTAEKTAHMLSLSGRLLRSCTNYEFFNCTEDDESAQHGDYVAPERANEDVDLRPAAITPIAPFLRLKRAERDFLKFLRMILGDQTRTPSHQSAYPLSHVPLETRQYTYAVAVQAGEVLNDDIDMEEALTGADALQVVYDIDPTETHKDVPYMLGEVFSRARRATVLPIIIELNFNSYGTDPGVKDVYVQHLRFCLRLAPEFLFVNMGLDDAAFQDVLNLKGNTRIIAQSAKIHRFPKKWDDEQCMTMLDRAQKAGCDIIQMSSVPGNLKDNAGVPTFRYKLQSRSLPVSVFNTGLLGRPTQCFNPILTPVTSQALNPPHEDSTISSITAEQATQALFASFICERLRFNILGATVEFSLSPDMHNAAFGALGMPHTYKALSTKSLSIMKDLASDPLFGGASVTQPYKIEMLEHLTSLSRHASIIRAVNTILPVRLPYDGSAPTDSEIVRSRNRAGPIHYLHGDNTDWIGIRACIRRGLSPINTVRPHTCGLVIGAGGMARASIYAMLHMGVKNIFIYSRTASSAEELADYYNNLDPNAVPGRQRFLVDGNTHQPDRVHVIKSLDESWPSGFRPPTMIVSSVPATKNTDGKLEAPFALPTSWLNSPTGGVLLEHTYMPLNTALVRQVRAQEQRGWIVMTGLDMLPEQAFAQFELFTGRRAPRRVMKAEVMKALREAEKDNNDDNSA